MPGRSLASLTLPALPGFGSSAMKLDAAARIALLHLARAPRAVTWQVGTDISAASNAHRTNSVAELQDALASDHDWLEGDVRMHEGRAVLAHGPASDRSMALRDWVAVGAASRRGLKLDFKDASAIEPAARMLHDAGVPDGRIIFNVTCTGAGRRAASPRALHALRARFPGAIINLDPGPAPYDDRSIATALSLARTIGDPIMFPLDAAHVDERIIRAFRAGGRVAIWNDPRRHDPGDLARATRRLRHWGANGMIDLRRFAPEAPAGR